MLMLLCSGCGLSIYNDWKSSEGQAIVGGGAIAGKDYVNGLLPSENSRKYFARIPVDNKSLETIRRTDESESKSGVKFVKNGGILIPPGVTISFTNKGYCMDPHLPAPKTGDEFQLVPVTRLIPDELQGTYKKLINKASAGDVSVQKNMQHLIWALRTAGTNAAYANNLTTEQKRILDKCSDYQGQFEDFNTRAKSRSQMMKELIGMADQLLNIQIGGVSYKASDLLDPDIGSKKINEHLNQLIQIGNSLPVERSGFNYGAIQSGIYTDVRGTGSLQYHAKIANSTSEPFIFYPTDYVGQVGSGTKSQNMTFMATADTSQRQRVTTEEQDEVDVEDEREVEEDEDEYEYVCAMGCTDGCRAAAAALAAAIRSEYRYRQNIYYWEEVLGGLLTGFNLGGKYVMSKTVKKLFKTGRERLQKRIKNAHIKGKYTDYKYSGKSKGGPIDMRTKKAKELYEKAKKGNLEDLKRILNESDNLDNAEMALDVYEMLLAENKLDIALGILGMIGVPGTDEAEVIVEVARISDQTWDEVHKRTADWNSYVETQWSLFRLRHKQIKRKRNCGSTPTY